MRTHAAHPRALGAALALVALLGAAACASSGGGRAAPEAVGAPVRVRVLSYRSKQAFELVNESHSDRVELYSEKRPDASTKVQTDEVMDALLEHMRDQGFFRFAQEGAAPQAGSASITRAIEVGSPEGTWSFVVGPGTPEEERRSFDRCFAAFLDLYNATYQLQSVDPGWTPPSAKGRR